MAVWLGWGLLWSGMLSGFGQDSPPSTAPLRLRLELAPNAAWPAGVGTVEVSPGLDKGGRQGVFDAAGRPVAVETLWSASGEATVLRFDTSGGGRSYYVGYDPHLPVETEGWKPRAGVVLATSHCSDQHANNATQMAHAVATAGPVLGRGYVPNIFLGINPYGPSSYYLADFSGWFMASAAGTYGFATVSGGPSYLQVDGRTVAEWLGNHSPWAGRGGQHGGEIALRAGLHHLEYVGLEFEGDVAGEAAWKPPGEANFVLMPASAFPPVAQFRVAGFESATQPEQLYFDWTTVDHCMLDDAMAVRVRFRAVDNGQRRDYHWHFDDGGEAVGLQPQHFFPQPGMRGVTLEAWEQGVRVATNATRIRIAPNWSQRDWWREGVFNDAKSEFLHRDLTRMPPRDVMALMNLATRADDPDLLTGTGRFMVQRAPEFTSPGDAAEFYRLGVVFRHRGEEGDVLAEKCFRLALAPERDLGLIASKVKLRLADLLIDWSGKPEEAEGLLGEVHNADLSGDEVRLRRLLAGDLLLARGQVEAARKQYLTLDARRDDPPSAAACAARLEGVSILIEHDQFADARQALDALIFAFPLERMSLDAGLLEIQLALKQKEYRRVLTVCRRLLPAAEGDTRLSQFLFATVESARALGQDDAAQPALTRLLRDFPYSEAAAKAKDRWPNR